jgi:WD40 repeat protein
MALSLAAALIALALFAHAQTQRADEATAARAVAESAIRLIDTDPSAAAEAAFAAMAASRGQGPPEVALAARVVLARSRLLATLTHDEVGDLSFDADGVAVAMASARGGRFRIIDLESGIDSASAQMESVLRSEASLVALDPGGRILVGAAGNEARVWDARTGRPLADLGSHAAAIVDLAMSPGGTVVVAASADASVRFTSATTGAIIRTVNLDPERPIEALACFATGARELCAAGDTTGRVSLIDLASGRVVDRLTTKGSVVDLAWVRETDSEGETGSLAGLAGSGLLKVWAARGWRETLVAHADRNASDVAISRTQVAAAGGDDVVVWSREGVVEARVPTRAADIAFVPEGTFDRSQEAGMLVVADLDGGVRLFETVDSSAATAVAAGMASQVSTRVTAVASGDTTAVRAVGDARGTVSIADAGTVSAAGPTISTGAPVRALAFADDDASLFAMNRRGVLSEIRVSDGEMLTQTSLGEDLLDVALAPSSNLVVTLDRLGAMRGYALHEPRELWAIPPSRPDRSLSRLAVSKDGERLAAAGSDEIRLFSVRDRRPLRRIPIDQQAGGVTLVALAPTGHHLVLGYGDGRLSFHGDKTLVADGTTARMLEPARSAAFVEGADLVATASDDGAVRLWDLRDARFIAVVRSPRPARERTARQRSSAVPLAFGPTGTSLSIGATTYTCRACIAAEGLRRAMRALVVDRGYRPPPVAWPTDGRPG